MCVRAEMDARVGLSLEFSVGRLFFFWWVGFWARGGACLHTRVLVRPNVPRPDADTDPVGAPGALGRGAAVPAVDRHGAVRSGPLCVPARPRNPVPHLRSSFLHDPVIQRFPRAQRARSGHPSRAFGDQGFNLCPKLFLPQLFF